MTADKQLAALDPERVLWKAKNGLALNLKELTLATGYGYTHWRTWKARGLPLIAGKIPLKKALDWLDKHHAAAEGESATPDLSHLLRAAESKFGGRV